MSATSNGIAIAVETQAAALQAPEQLQESVERHQDRLIGLANAFIAEDYDEEAIRLAVEVVLNSYKDELAHIIVTCQGSQKRNTASS